MNTKINVLVSSNRNALLKVENVLASVEAEFGAFCVEGPITLAHHGERSGNPAPCITQIDRELVDRLLSEGKGNIICSHIDLDTVGGIMRLDGYTPFSKSEENFWGMAAKVDVQGPHMLDSILKEFDNASQLQSWLNAYWAWSEGNKTYPPRDGSLLDITEAVNQHVDVLTKIFQNDEELLSKGREFEKKGEELNRRSLVGSYATRAGLVLSRESDQFVNHLYQDTLGKVAAIVVAFNTKTKTITVSKAHPEIRFNCREFVQGLWGMEAGGHDGIAGSPRNREMKKTEFSIATSAAANLINS
jgi:hypothetical protein